MMRPRADLWIKDIRPRASIWLHGGISSRPTFAGRKSADTTD